MASLTRSETQDCWLGTTKKAFNSGQTLFLMKGWGLRVRLQDRIEEGWCNVMLATTQWHLVHCFTAMNCEQATPFKYMHTSINTHNGTFMDRCYICWCPVEESWCTLHTHSCTLHTPPAHFTLTPAHFTLTPAHFTLTPAYQIKPSWPLMVSLIKMLV